MSGQDILIEQLRADVKRLELDLAAVAMCDSSDCGLCVSCLVKRAEKAECERGPAITRADARELLEMSGITTSDACYARVRAALREYAGSDFECSVRNPLDEAIARAEKAERERDEERHLADVRGEMLTKTERERDEAIADLARCYPPEEV